MVIDQFKDPNPDDKRIFVFGSNERGVHGAGAALFAKNFRGAVQYVGVGRTGQSYAIPTKDVAIKTLSLEVIQDYVYDFLLYAADHPELRFQLTAIGCGLAGYEARDIAPMFYGATSNIDFPPEWNGLEHL